LPTARPDHRLHYLSPVARISSSFGWVGEQSCPTKKPSAVLVTFGQPTFIPGPNSSSAVAASPSFGVFKLFSLVLLGVGAHQHWHPLTFTHHIFLHLISPIHLASSVQHSTACAHTTQKRLVSSAFPPSFLLSLLLPNYHHHHHHHFHHYHHVAKRCLYLPSLPSLPSSLSPPTLLAELFNALFLREILFFNRTPSHLASDSADNQLVSPRT